MDVHERSIYPSNIEATGVKSPARLQDSEASATTGSGSSGLGMDASQISATARTLAQAMQLPDVREERIVDLQQRIAAGNYQVPSSDVADAMLRSVAR